MTDERKRMTVKAIEFGAYGEPRRVLEIVERSVPKPGRGEARVRIFASPINPSDLLYVRGHYSGVEPHFPAPVGCEGVGVVDALEPGANGVTVALVRRGGACR
jgi:NADPH:quinone reductase-like Zn-dependent oxidoreductase